MLVKYKDKHTIGGIMTQFKKQKAPSSIILICGLLLIIWCGGCLSIYRDQTVVPGTDQRLIVGHNNWPTKKIWVLDKTGFHKVTIRREK